MVLLTPEQYADLVIRDVEQAHLDRRDDFLGVASYRTQIIEQFKAAIQAAYVAGETIGVAEFQKAQLEAMKDVGVQAN